MGINCKREIPNFLVIHRVGPDCNASVGEEEVDNAEVALCCVNEFVISCLGRKVDSKRNRAWKFGGNRLW
jgi:hypothetical protein